MNEDKFEKFMKILSTTDGIHLDNGDVAIPFQEINKIYNELEEELKNE